MALISEGYRDLNARLHESRPEYGTGVRKKLDNVAHLVSQYPDALDYGCGKAVMLKRWPVKCYDPAIPAYSNLPEPADLVLCLDVMEHVEAECIDEVLDHIYFLARKKAVFVICTRESSKRLDDGRNAHISIHDADWWIQKLYARWKTVSVEVDDDEVFAVCE